MKSLQSPFALHIKSYLALKRSLGYQGRSQEAILQWFDTFAVNRGYGLPLTQEMAVEFATEDPEQTSSQCSRRYAEMRHFAEYLTVHDPATGSLEPRILTRQITRAPAHIYTDAEITSLLDHARYDSKTHPTRAFTLYTIIGLAASTGLRLGEVVRLDHEDVDLKAGVLKVRQTKFYKDRLVPIHPTTVQALGEYAALRDSAAPNPACTAFFQHFFRERFQRQTLSLAFVRVAIAAGLRQAKGGGPSFHDLRHTFAVKRLVTWYQDGQDVQALLPVLATYLGHVHYSDTAWYLTATAELLGIAAERFFQGWKQEVPS